MRRKLTRFLVTSGIVAAITLGLFETAVRFLMPQQELYPRYRYSERYGHLLPISTTIVHRLPGHWRFVYSTNEYGFRVAMPEITNRYDRPNIVALGDSCTFGQGVNDGEQYTVALARRLADVATVVNLGVPGFGLTHEIRMFYEFGLLYQPAVVVLQFHMNDPDDNVYEKVTTLEHGRFRFHTDSSVTGPLRAVKNWLSDSVLQHSAAYNLVRNTAYHAWYRHVVRFETPEARQRKEAFYNELISAFAEDLQQRGIRLVMFDVANHFAKWPGVQSHLQALEQRGLVRVLETKGWFEGLRDYATPEGHPWGPLGHRIIAEHLADPLRASLAARAPLAAPRVVAAGQ
jgi:hypothetical protein